MKKRIITLIIILLLLIPWLVGPFVNDYIAKGIVRSIVDIPTPKNTDIVETSYKSGDLTSAAEGMEYFGAALIKTKLDLATLKRYYKQYSTDHLEYIVEAQPESKIKTQSAANAKAIARPRHNCFCCGFIFSSGTLR